jgi:hypothetical protein
MVVLVVQIPEIAEEFPPFNLEPIGEVSGGEIGLFDLNPFVGIMEQRRHIQIGRDLPVEKQFDVIEVEAVLGVVGAAVSIDTGCKPRKEKILQLLVFFGSVDVRSIYEQGEFERRSFFVF